MNKKNLIERYPKLYHMSEARSWPTIKQHGLLSTAAALNLFEIIGAQRFQLESCHRAENFVLESKTLGRIVLRDQKPMSDHRLSMGLEDDLTPRKWYETLNSKVFFWAQSERLERLLNARAYRGYEHIVFTIDTASLVNEYEHSIWLCHMNSGNTFPIPHRRGALTFKRIEDYPAKPNGNPKKEVVELVVDNSVSNFAKHIIEVRKMKGMSLIERILP